jgi:hypothetical protein
MIRPIAASVAKTVSMPMPLEVLRSNELSISENDPSQSLNQVGMRGPTAVWITGTASNDGRNPSIVTLTVDGKEVRVALEGGETPAMTAEKLKRALPAGYVANIKPFNDRTDGVSLQILRIKTHPQPELARSKDVFSAL